MQNLNWRALGVRTMVWLLIFLVWMATIVSGSFAMPTDSASPTIRTIPWSLTASRFRDQVGQDAQFYCPPNGTIQQVWGSDVYSDNSSICTAAVHAGVITREAGGAIAIRMLPGQSAYTGSTQNEVRSSNFVEWPGSFTFTTLHDVVVGVLDTPDGQVPIAVASWQTSASAFRDRLNETFAVYCPAAGEPAPIWGSDIYRDASSVCTAAVHAGHLNPRDGGAIAFRMVSRMPFYIGNTRNGVTARHWLGGTGSFVVL